ncbi:MAG: RsmD family RNA methyltransferase [Pirellulaceae bacterium]
MTVSPNDRNTHFGSSSGMSTSKLRIVGGTFRGRQIEYSGDLRTRPMKDSIRESLFNLIGAFLPGRCVFDLFAGTGAVGIEALSRGASQAIFVERHFPTAKIIRQNLASLADNLPAIVDTSDTFFWVRQFFKKQDKWPTEPWVVFCCPPYGLYRQRTKDVMGILAQFIELAPAGSVVVAETPNDFDTSLLPNADNWRNREYSPALLCVWRPPSYENWPNAEKTGQ